MTRLRESFAIRLLLIAALVLGSMTQIACGDKKLQQAAEAAKDIGGGTRDVIKAVGEAYQRGLITIEQKDKFADLLTAIARGGQKGTAAIAALHKAGVTKLSGEHSRSLSAIFDNEVVTPFLELLQELGKLSENSSAAIRAALISVRTAIVLLSSRIGRGDVIRAIEAREVLHA